MQVMNYLEDSIEISPYFARSRLGLGFHLQTLSLFSWKFSFSWKYIEVTWEKRGKTSSLTVVAWLPLLWKRGD